MSIISKLRCLQSKIKSWNQEVFEDLYSRASAVSQELDAFEVTLESQPLSSAEL